MQTGAAPQPPSLRDEELKALKEQSQKMKQDLETIQERIDALTKKKG